MEESINERIARLEAQAANDHSILRDLHEQQKKFYGALTALQTAFDVLIASMDPNAKPPQGPPRPDLM
jgi:hypothetical protein